jgi:hypothetical protein
MLDSTRWPLPRSAAQLRRARLPRIAIGGAEGGTCRFED